MKVMERANQRRSNIAFVKTIPDNDLLYNRVTVDKSTLLAEMCKKSNCDILLLQKIPGALGIIDERSQE